MPTIEVKMVLKKNNEEKKVFFFTSINGPFLTDDDVIHAISEKIEDMTLKYSHWAKCGFQQLCMKETNCSQCLLWMMAHQGNHPHCGWAKWKIPLAINE